MVLIHPSSFILHPSSFRYYQLTHDYLVHSLRDWLTRKQRETRRGRAELRLAERAALWSAKHENRRLPSVLEWANIRALTKKRDWTETERRMMKRAGRWHGWRSLGLATMAALLAVVGLNIRDRVVDANQAIAARGLVRQIVSADTAKVPDLIRAIKTSDRRWTDPDLTKIGAEAAENSKEKLHASLALLTVEPGQAEYLYRRLLNANPQELPVIRKALDGHQAELVERLWVVLENAQASPDQRFCAACALAGYVPGATIQRWLSAAGFITERLLASVIKNPSDYAPLLETLRPIRKRLLASLSATFRDPQRPDTERSFSTNILTDYAADQPATLADLLMDSGPKAYAALFPASQAQEAETVPFFQAEIGKKATSEWNDPPRDASWAELDSTAKSRIESAGGLVAERFAFCQTLPLGEFLPTAEGLRKSGYRPIRFRPYPDGPVVRVAAVWNRDGRKWRLASGLTAEDVRSQDEEVRRGPPEPAGTADSVGRGSPDPAQAPDRRSPAPSEADGSGRPSVPGRAGSGDPRPTLRATTKYVPVDVAGYVAAGADRKPADRYAIVWVEKARADDDAEIVTSLAASELEKIHNRFKSAHMAPMALSAFQGTDGRTSYCGIWHKSATSDAAVFHYDLGELKLLDELAQHAAITLNDLSIGVAAAPATVRDRASGALQRAEASLKAKPDDQSARLARASAYFQLGEYLKAIDDLDGVIEKAPQGANALQLRCIAHARLGHKDEARADLAKFRKSDSDPSTKLYLSVIAAAELGEGAGQAFEELEAALKNQPKDLDLAYNAACAYALASQALGRKDQTKRQPLADRAIGLLKAAIANGYSDFNHMREDADLDPIRGLPVFGEIMKGGHLDRVYAAVWTGDVGLEANPVFGLDPDDHLQRCRELESEGYRMVSLSVVWTSPDRLPVTASVWHRPVVSEEAKDRLAERQARAAVALVRLGRANEVWTLLRHSTDPRLRSFMINWLNPLGADPKPIATELDRLDNVGRGTPNVGRGSPDPAQEPDRRSPAPGETVDSGRPSDPGRAATLRVPGDPRPTRPGDPRPTGSGDLATTGDSPATRHSTPATYKMDTILFHPETSQRRALILALGTYGMEGLSPGEREPLIGKLLDLYRNDPDSGIHGAAEWALRQWKQQEKLKELDAGLMNFKERGDRRWFVNSQGQTFAVIEGPVEFRMGSPPTEPTRNATMESPRRMVIPRRFAIAAKEVTLEQWQRFERTNTELGLAPSFVKQWSPDPDGPMIGFTWYIAAKYCNWLSDQEGLSKDQWCYLPAGGDAYAEGMTIPADVLERRGYRLPTEPEWEYACRAGALTSRYYGHSIDLLDAYARYQANSNEHAGSCGSLLPNDLGLFDVLGNEYEWVQDSMRRSMPGSRGLSSDIINISESVDEKLPRLLRGGAFNNLPALVRSAFRSWNAPSGRSTLYGFRPSRTYR